MEPWCGIIIKLSPLILTGKTSRTWDVPLPRAWRGAITWHHVTIQSSGKSAVAGHLDVSCLALPTCFRIPCLTWVCAADCGVASSLQGPQSSSQWPWQYALASLWCALGSAAFVWQAWDNCFCVAGVGQCALPRGRMYALLFLILLPSSYYVAGVGQLLLRGRRGTMCTAKGSLIHSLTLTHSHSPSVTFCVFWSLTHSPLTPSTDSLAHADMSQMKD